MTTRSHKYQEFATTAPSEQSRVEQTAEMHRAIDEAWQKEKRIEQKEARNTPRQPLATKDTASCFVTVNGEHVPIQLARLQPYHFTLEDTAHALSLINRYNGHTKHPYSLATHALNCLSVAEDFYGIADEHFLMRVMLRKAHKAFMGDLPQPFQHFLGVYSCNLLKSNIQGHLKELYGWREKPEVKTGERESKIIQTRNAEETLNLITAQVTLTETSHLMAGPPFPQYFRNEPIEPLPLKYFDGLTEAYPWEMAQDEFKVVVEALFDKLHPENGEPY
jgi:hypothetical protein